MSDFKQRLSTALSESALNKGGLANNTGVALSTVTRWFHGTIPKTDKLEEIAIELGVNAKWLLTGNGSKHPKSDESDIKQQTTSTQMVKEDPQRIAYLDRIIQKRSKALDAGLETKIRMILAELEVALYQFPSINKLLRNRIKDEAVSRINELEQWCDDLDQ